MGPGRAEGLSGSGLKLIAIVTMFLDHIGAAILESPVVWAFLGSGEEIDPFFNSSALALCRDVDLVFRFAGRIAFPIFCFLLVEGFLHTRSLPRYMGRMAAFALLSEIPYDLAFEEGWFDPKSQNVYFTLLLGLLAMAAVRYFLPRSALLALAGAAGCAVLAQLLRADHGAFGVVLILLLYILRDREPARTVIGSLALCGEITAPLAFLPIRRYNGQRGRLGGKWFFYGFYPAHILLLWGFRGMVFGG